METLAACFTFVATASGLVRPSGGNCFQFFDAMLAAMLFSGFVLEGHFKLAAALVSGIELVGHIVAVANLRICSGRRPAGQFCKATLKGEESTEPPVSLVSSKDEFQGFSSGTLACPEGETSVHHLQRRQRCLRRVPRVAVPSCSRI